MISKFVGTLLKKNTKTKVWWFKLAASLVLSNVFFFALFGGGSDPVQEINSQAGLVEVQLNASLLTPFTTGKKVLLVNRHARARVEGILNAQAETSTTVAVQEKDAVTLLSQEGWEILPYLKDFKFRQIAQGESYEIRY